MIRHPGVHLLVLAFGISLANAASASPPDPKDHAALCLRDAKNALRNAQAGNTNDLSALKEMCIDKPESDKIRAQESYPEISRTFNEATRKIAETERLAAEKQKKLVDDGWAKAAQQAEARRAEEGRNEQAEMAQVADLKRGRLERARTAIPHLAVSVPRGELVISDNRLRFTALLSGVIDDAPMPNSPEAQLAYAELVAPDGKLVPYLRGGTNHYRAVLERTNADDPTTLSCRGIREHNLACSFDLADQKLGTYTLRLTYAERVVSEQKLNIIEMASTRATVQRMVKPAERVGDAIIDDKFTVYWQATYAHKEAPALAFVWMNGTKVTSHAQGRNVATLNIGETDAPLLDVHESQGPVPEEAWTKQPNAYRLAVFEKGKGLVASFKIGGVIDSSWKLGSLLPTSDLTPEQRAVAKSIAAADLKLPAPHKRESVPDAWACGAVRDVKFFDLLHVWDATQKAKCRGSNAASRLSQGGLSAIETQRLQSEARGDANSARNADALGAKLRGELNAKSTAFSTECVKKALD
jgi:hypothetical protein